VCVDLSTASSSFLTSPSVRENLSVSASRTGLTASTPFSVSQEDCDIEQLYACGLVHFLARSTVGWSDRNFSRMPAVCGLGDRCPSSQLRSEAKVI
jgi:hypothetical protein